MGQNITKSPYSSKGLGEMLFGGSAQLHGMGQISQGVRVPSILNNQNPASYSSLQYTIWDVAGLGVIGSYSSAKSSSGANSASFAYFAAGFKISQKKGWGLSFGLMPYSAVGYNFKRNITTPTFSGSEVIQGRGGLSKAYIGTGFRIAPKISFGANISYVFGQVSQTTLLNIPAEYKMYNTIENRDRYTRGLTVDLGAQYADTFIRLDANRNEHYYQYGVGLTVSPQVGLNTSDNKNIRSLGIGNTNTSSIGKDTIAQQSVSSGEVILPMNVKAGVFFQEINHWGVGVDVGYQTWQNYKAFGNADSLKNTFSVQIGAFYKPNKNNSKSYFNKIEYRAGFRYDNGMLSTNNYNVSTSAVSVGLGLPIDRVVSKLNLSFEYLVRGTTQYSLLKEEYFRFVIGVSINDNQWFRRYKYD